MAQNRGKHCFPHTIEPLKKGAGIALNAIFSARSKNSTLHAKMYDDASVAAWASASAACVAAHGLDGVLLDMEGGGDSSDPAKRNQTQRDAIVKGVCALKQQLTAQIPGSVLFWTTDTVSAPSCAVYWR